MSEAPDGWANTQLGELLSAVIGGGTPSKSNPAYFRGGIPFMTVKDLHTRFVFDTQDHISQEALDNSASRQIPADTLVIATRMSLGKITRPKVATAINQDLKALFLHSGVDKTYVEYLWRANENRIRSMGTGTTVKGIRIEDIRNLAVPLAPIAEQTRIADQLDTLLARVNTCNDRFNAIRALLKRFRQTVLRAATCGELTSEWRETNADEVSPEEVITERLRIPQGARQRRQAEDFSATHLPARSDGLRSPSTWVTTHVGMVGVVSNGSTPSRKELSYWNGSISWVSSGEVNNNVILETREKITETGYASSSVHLLPRGSVLIAMIGEGKTRGQSALLAIDACINQNIAGIVPVPSLLNSSYLWYWFRAEYEVTRSKGNGSGPKALNCERVRELEVNLPPLAEQTEIVRRVEVLFALADRIETRCNAARAKAQRLTPLLLAKAFRGELLPQDPNDEPASVLLARIQAERDASATLAPAATRKPRHAAQVKALPKSHAQRKPKESVAMTKRRQDDDVNGKPYLAGHLRRMGAPATAEALFKAAELPVADFYKQLAWEVGQGHVKDGKDGATLLEAGDAAR